MSGLNRFLIFAAIFVLDSQYVAQGFQITRLVPIATADSLRIELAFRCESKDTGISLDAVIADPADATTLWQGNLTSTRDFAQAGAGTFVVTNSIKDLKPKLWSPAVPKLYELKVTATRDKTIITNWLVHVGFRSFESRNGQIYLNGRPLFLRGLAINPPGRTVPDTVGESRAFAQDYVRFLKNQNVNIIRLTHDSQTWFDVCDELGIMVYQGQYGSPLGSEAGKSRPPANVDKSIAAYRSLFETYARHPSIVIYILANELPVSGSRGKAYHEFLSRVHAALKLWDDTRLYIGNAGYGEGREGDLCDVHRYWGWYYNTFLTYYNLRNQRLFGEPAKNQPVTFSECVGNFTGPLGEYNQIVRKQLGAQLNWTGHSPNQREDALRYQGFMTQQAAESFRRLRSINPRLAGLMPFTTLFYNWSGVQSFDQMQAKPAMDSLRTAYQPILLSWELWTPHLYAGSRLTPIAHIVNDSDLGLPLTNANLIVEIQTTNHATIISSNIPLTDLAYYFVTSRRLALNIPASTPSARYWLSGKIVSADKVVSQNQTELFIAGKDWISPPPPTNESIYVFDPDRKTSEALRKLNIPINEIEPRQPWPTNIPALVVGEFALLANRDVTTNLNFVLEHGGHILCLRQMPDSLAWLPEPITCFNASANEATYPPASRPFRDNMHVNPERPAHPIFQGLDRRQFETWSDYSGWDQTKPGYPFIYPVDSGFELKNYESLARTAILADYDRGLEGVALCEMFTGKGSVIVSAFDLVMRSGIDPAADRLLANLVKYTATPSGHDAHPLIAHSILWGDYASEQGVITGPGNGLVVNSDWVKPTTNPSAKPLTQEEGAWNTRPGDQFVPHGRRPFGPYGYSTGSGLKDLNTSSTTGTGVFWIRIPEGKSRLISVVENRSDSTKSLNVQANEAAQDFPLPPGKLSRLSLPLPPQTSDLRVQYRGDKNLVLLETNFE